MHIYSLFFDYPESINISSIRIIETATNYQEIIQAITLFDNALSNNIEERVNVSSESLLVLKHLIYERNENKFDLFIYNTWKVFVQKKNRNYNKYVLVE